MKKNQYIQHTEYSSDVYLCYNSYNNKFLFLNKEKYLQFESLNDKKAFKDIDKDLYELLKENQFIVEDDFNGYENTLYAKNKMRYNSSTYHLMINTTLDCNLNCWYCYENRVKGSKLDSSVIEAIKKNIAEEYMKSSFKVLKVSFFGGEPLFYFEGVKSILDYCKAFCEEKGIEIIADFTTNATLITKEVIDYLKSFRCHFQITLDGNRETHNLVKKDNKNTDTYGCVIQALRLIEKEISQRWVAVRINFTNKTLKYIDEIISDIDFMNRKTCYVILKKVWQVKTEQVSQKLLFNAIQKLFNKSFLVDYYVMPKGSICYAERYREVLINYDGKIFKCSTIGSFDDANSLGKLNYKTGQINWEENKISIWMNDMTPQYCKECKWFPACLGPCNKQIIAHKKKKICTFDAMNMSQKDYLIYLFKFNYLLKELNKI